MKSSVSWVLLASIFLQTLPAAAQSTKTGRDQKAVKEPTSHQQHPIMNIPNILLPPSKGNDSTSGSSGDLSLSDVIGKEKMINIFAGFTRDIDTVSKRLTDSEENTTVLAPLNSAIQKLPRKPWEDPGDYESLGANAYKGANGEDRAHKNLRIFTEAHIVPASPWKEGEKVESMGGGTLWWVEKEGKKLVRAQTCQWGSPRDAPIH